MTPSRLSARIRAVGVAPGAELAASASPASGLRRRETRPRRVAAVAASSRASPRRPAGVASTPPVPLQRVAEAARPHQLAELLRGVVGERRGRHAACQ